MKIIDPHVHLFAPQQGEYKWLKPDNPPYWPDKERINRSFFETDLLLPSPHQLAGFVHIEAGFDNSAPWREIQWLERTVTLPFKAIACVDITLSLVDFKIVIEQLRYYRSVVGVRHILDDRAEEILTHPHALVNLQWLADCDLLFETQLLGDDVKAVDVYSEIVTKVPTLTCILSHALFCPRTHNARQRWLTMVAKLAKSSNVYIKASGWEMVARGYNMTHIEWAITQLLDYFGQYRLMLASNFPLVLLSNSYTKLWQDYLNLSINDSILEQLLGANAQRLYRI